MSKSYRYTPEMSAEILRRIRVSVAAAAYECLDFQTMTDADFDRTAAAIDLAIDTNRPDLDAWFRAHFSPHTGQWVHHHPERGLLIERAKWLTGRRDTLPPCSPLKRLGRPPWLGF